MMWTTARSSSALLVALLLGVIVAFAPLMNAKGKPPRSVFHVLPNEVSQPEIALQAKALGGGRFRLFLDATAFTFTELCVAHANAAAIGHAHVHVDGQKVASAYLPVIEIGPLPPGDHVIDVVLRGQDHRPLVAQQGLVRAVTDVSVPGGRV